MNTASHIIIGRLLCESFHKNQIVLNEKAFVFGNIKPDLSIDFMKRPHYKNVCMNDVKRKIERLSVTGIEDVSHVSAKYSEALGIICHYIADFFCLAHNSYFYASTFNHITYENGLKKYLCKNLEAIQKECHFPTDVHFESISELLEHFEELHKEYFGLTPSMKRDISYSLQVCTEMATALIEFSKSCYHKQIEESTYQRGIAQKQLLFKN